MSHTAGPWTVEGRFWVAAGGDENRLVADVYDGSPLSDKDQSDEDVAQTVANARLIAAAPDLLAACEAAFEHGFPQYAEASVCQHCARAASLLEAAIAKAKGEAVPS